MMALPPGLTAALARVPDNAWTPPSNYQDNRIHHLYQRLDIVTAGNWTIGRSAFGDLLDPIERQGVPIHDMRLSRIAPGGYVVNHTDASRWRDRWHIPIQAAGITMLNGTVIHTETGVPFRVQQWLPHLVFNDSDRDRIHLIIDTTQYVGPNETRPFVVL